VACCKELAGTAHYRRSCCLSGRHSQALCGCRSIGTLGHEFGKALALDWGHYARKSRAAGRADLRAAREFRFRDGAGMVNCLSENNGGRAEERTRG